MLVCLIAEILLKDIFFEAGKELSNLRNLFYSGAVSLPSNEYVMLMSKLRLTRPSRVKIVKKTSEKIKIGFKRPENYNLEDEG